MQTRSRDAVGPGLIFLNLLEADAQLAPQNGLRPAQGGPPGGDAQADGLVDMMTATRHDPSDFNQSVS